MSAMSTLHAEYEALKAKIQAEASHLVDEFESLFHKAIGQGEKDAVDLAHQAESDAAAVVVTAETEGLKPAEVEAVADAAKLGADAVHDAETAVTAKPAEAPASETPATPNA